ncbi:MAG: hypothetical protein ACW981_06990 [Candidatus Hodarchaeales archaeon]|jgi:hypothetical protein
MKAYNEAISIVEENKLVYWDLEKKKVILDKDLDFEDEFFKKYENIPKDLLQLVLDWIFYWYHKM